MSIRSGRHHSVTRHIVALVVLIVSALLALPASAGALHTTDDAGVLTSAQLTKIRSRTQSYDFDVRLVTSSHYASKSDLGDYVHRLVTEPNLVVVGIDPVHRHFSVHFGTGTRIADSEFKAIESAGVANFKEGDWAGGALAILDRAERAVGTGGGRRAGAPLAAPERTSSGFGTLFWIVVIVGGIGVILWLVARRRTYASPPVAYGPPAGGFGPPVGGYVPPGGGYVQPGAGFGAPGGSGLGGNIVSAGLGGLVGYELGKEVAERHHHHYEDGGPRVYERVDDDPPPGWNGGGDSAEPGNYDAGGGSGGWDDSGSGGSSDGGGGGDSDF